MPPIIGDAIGRDARKLHAIVDDTKAQQWGCCTARDRARAERPPSHPAPALVRGQHTVCRAAAPDAALVGQDMRRVRRVHALFSLLRPWPGRPPLANEWPQRSRACLAACGVLPHSGSTPIVCSHVSTRRGHRPIGSLGLRRPKAWPPCAYRCISVGTPAFCRAT